MATYNFNFSNAGSGGRRGGRGRGDGVKKDKKDVRCHRCRVFGHYRSEGLEDIVSRAVQQALAAQATNAAAAATTTTITTTNNALGLTAEALAIREKADEINYEMDGVE